MAFFNSAVTVLQTLVIALGAGLGIWGAINLLEGTATTTLVQMLMYGKEADNRKQELDRQHHTIPCNINMKESLCREIIGGAFSIRHGQKCREKFD